MKFPSISINQMAMVDKIAMNVYKISLYQMMENAGRLLAQHTINKHKPKSVTVLVGKGYNGGGGLVAARYFHNRNVKVNVVLTSCEMKAIVFDHLKAIEKLNIPIFNKPRKTDIYIDCLLGYNGKGQPKDTIKEIVSLTMDKKVISLDIPTGVNLKTGKFYDISYKNSEVLTIGCPKRNVPRKKMYVADIGIPREIYSNLGIKMPILKSDITKVI